MTKQEVNKILKLCFKHKIYFRQAKTRKGNYAMLLSKASYPRKIRCMTYEQALEAVEIIRNHKYEVGRKPQFTPVDKRIVRYTPEEIASRYVRVRTNRYDENGRPLHLPKE